MSANATTDPIQPKPNRAHKAPDVLRENDGRHQLVGYLGWKTIFDRLTARQQSVTFGIPSPLE